MRRGTRSQPLHGPRLHRGAGRRHRCGEGVGRCECVWKGGRGTCGQPLQGPLLHLCHQCCSLGASLDHRISPCSPLPYPCFPLSAPSKDQGCTRPAPALPLSSPQVLQRLMDERDFIVPSGKGSKGGAGAAPALDYDGLAAEFTRRRLEDVLALVWMDENARAFRGQMVRWGDCVVWRWGMGKAGLQGAAEVLRCWSCGVGVGNGRRRLVRGSDGASVSLLLCLFMDRSAHAPQPSLCLCLRTLPCCTLCAGPAQLPLHDVMAHTHVWYSAANMPAIHDAPFSSPLLHPHPSPLAPCPCCCTHCTGPAQLPLHDVHGSHARPIHSCQF